VRRVEAHDADIRRLSVGHRSVDGDCGDRVVVRVNAARYVGHCRRGCGCVGCFPDFATGGNGSRERPIAKGCRIDNLGEPVGVLRSTGSYPGNLVDFAAAAQGCIQGVEIDAQLAENGSCRVANPHPARANQHFVGVLRIQNIRRVERPLINVSGARIARESLSKGVGVVAGRSVLANLDHRKRV